jgi:hypothetical protein
LEQRRVAAAALGVDGLDHAIERDVLAVECIERQVAHARDQRAERGIVRQVAA